MMSVSCSKKEATFLSAVSMDGSGRIAQVMERTALLITHQVLPRCQVVTTACTAGPNPSQKRSVLRETEPERYGC